MSQTPAERVADVLVREYPDELREMVRRTRENGHETALTAFRRSGGRWSRTDMETGTATAVTIPSPPTSAVEAVGVHSHPVPGPIGFSVEDYLQFARFYVMSQPFSGEPARGYAVVGQRFNDMEAGRGVVHVIAPTAAMSAQSIVHRRHLVQTIQSIKAETPRDERELSFPQTDAIREALSAVTAETYRQFPIADAGQPAPTRAAHSPVFDTGAGTGDDVGAGGDANVGRDQ
jgi:hypothetical protein